MDELELRILAAEEAVIALAAHVQPADVVTTISHLWAEAASVRPVLDGPTVPPLADRPEGRPPPRRGQDQHLAAA